MTETEQAGANTAPAAGRRHSDADRIIIELQTAWQQPDAGRRAFGTGTPFRPIANSAEDQTSPASVYNPLWDIVRWMPAEPPWHGGTLEPTYTLMAFDRTTGSRLTEIGASRDHLATRYAWSIISPGDVTWMVEQLGGRPVIEIGAGTGYWAWQLEQAGVDVAAYDPNPPGEDNKYCKAGPYATVLQDDASAIKHHQDRVLLMVWPPYGGEHARHALSVYEGDLLLYAGESHGGCTADWDKTSIAPGHVTWWGIHCELAAYRRRGGAANA